MNWSLGRWSRRKNLFYQRKLGGELEKQIELLQKVLADKENEITKVEDRLRQAKEEAIHEYRNSDALLAELGGSFAEGFDDCLCQVKAPHPDLDLSNININAPAQTSVQPILSKSTDELFTDDVPSDGKTTQVEDNTCHPDMQDENEQNSPV